MASTILQVSGLTKQYGEFTAVNNISFSVKEGEIVGLLGPNGAGKTTTMQILLGLTTATSGKIEYFGREFPKEREYILSRINFASAYTQIQGRLTVLENFRIFAGLYDVDGAEKRIRELLSLLEIEQTVHSLFWTLSSGQKTRVILAKALLNRPRLILMDEPTASLDPDIANKVLELILELQKKEKTTILITSHDMAEVEELCDRVIFLDHGHIVAEDTPLGLTKKIGTSTLTITFDGPEGPVAKYLKQKKYAYTFPRAHVAALVLPEKEIPSVLFGLSKTNIWVTDIDIKKPDLEDVFLSVAKGRYES
jgi:ABC-2 type transport system ATP-binding protein